MFGSTNKYSTLALVAVSLTLIFSAFLLHRHRRRKHVSRFRFPPVSLTVPPEISVGYTKRGQHPYVGDVKHATVNMEIFCDLQCPYCRLLYAFGFNTIFNETSALAGDVSMTFYDFPLSFHKAAIPAAVAARCAGIVNGASSYWRMHLVILSKNLYQVKDYRTSFTAYANKIWGSNETFVHNFTKCYDEKTPMKAIESDYKIGLSRGVKGTPTLLINGNVSSARVSTDLQRDIDLARKKVSGGR